MTTLSLSVLGLPRVEQGNVPLEVDTRKAIALLVYLAVTNQPHDRLTLCHLLWTTKEPSLARAALRRTLSTLKKALASQWLLIERDTIALPAHPTIQLDTAVYQHCLTARSQHPHPPSDLCPDCLSLLTEAVNLYRDDFLAGFDLQGADAFAEWRFYEAERFRRYQQEALSHLITGHAQQGAYPLAITYARQLVALDPFQEGGHRRLMQLYAWNNQQTEALLQYETCAQLIEAQLGLAPEAETITLYEKIKAGGLQRPASQTRHRIPPLTRSRPVSDNLPLFLTPFMGREEELEEITERLDNAACRLLTITGPGGVGKTRLAVQAGQQQQNTFTDGVYFVPLAPLSSPDSLVPAVADALSFTFWSRQDPHRQLIDYLQPKNLLLILDNFEHLQPAAPVLVDLLKQTPHVKIVVTSRSSLNLWSEWLYEVYGLSFPPTINHDGEPMGQFSAVQLFCHHIHRIRPNWTMSPVDKVAVWHICHHLHGLPLALELAAALARQYDIPEVAARIQADLDTLSTPMLDIPDRHRSLRTVFEHSWELLSPHEKAAFQKLAVFRGHFSGEAAVAITGTSEAILTTLVDHSLLQIQEGRGARYHIHSLLQQYAWEKLSIPERKEVKTAHGRYYLHFLSQQEPRLEAAQQPAALKEIRLEIENILMGWGWLLQQNATAAIDQALHSLYRFYEMQGRFHEGKDIFAQAVSTLENQADHQPVTARLLSRQAVFCCRLGLYEQATAMLEKSNPVFHQHHLPLENAFALNNLGVIKFGEGNLDDARQLYEESLILYNKLDHLVGKAVVLNNLGNYCHASGLYQQARQKYQESLRCLQTLGDESGIMKALNGLALAAESLGDYEVGEQLLQESFALAQKLENQRGMVFTLHNQGYLAASQGEYVKAKQLYEASLQIRREIGDRNGIGLSLLKLGDVSYALSSYTEAKALYEEAMAIFQSLHDQVGLTVAWQHLGKIENAQGHYQKAFQHLVQALSLCLSIKIKALWSETLIETAVCLAGLGQTGRALQILTAVQQDPATEKKALKVAEGHLSRLQPHHPSPLPSQTIELEAIIQEIIATS